MTDKNFLGYAKMQQALNDAKYNDGTSVQYQFNYQPSLSISSWEDIPLVTQTNLLAKAVLDDLQPTN